jgi:probable DNA metabolism protein
MAVWTYDGTFPGLLSALAELLARREEPEDLIPRREAASADDPPRGARDPVQGLLFGVEPVPTALDRAEALAETIRARLGERALEAVLLAFLSGRPRIGTALWRFLDLGRRIGPEVLRRLEDPRVRTVALARRATCGEAHRFLGLVRFAELKGALYAPLEPRADILELLAPHFARRLPGERWALHDVGRRKALIHEGGRILPAEAPGEPLPAEEDEALRRLWRTYFDAIRIEHRVNPRLQKRFIPERYWKYLPEKAPLPLEG